jgi:hypothetical protein
MCTHLICVCIQLICVCIVHVYTHVFMHIYFLFLTPGARFTAGGHTLTHTRLQSHTSKQGLRLVLHHLTRRVLVFAGMYAVCFVYIMRSFVMFGPHTHLQSLTHMHIYPPPHTPVDFCRPPINQATATLSRTHVLRKHEVEAEGVCGRTKVRIYVCMCVCV